MKRPSAYFYGAVPELDEYIFPEMHRDKMIQRDKRWQMMHKDGTITGKKSLRAARAYIRTNLKDLTKNNTYKPTVVPDLIARAAHARKFRKTTTRKVMKRHEYKYSDSLKKTVCAEAIELRKKSPAAPLSSIYDQVAHDHNLSISTIWKWMNKQPKVSAASQPPVKEETKYVLTVINGKQYAVNVATGKSTLLK